MTTLYRYPVPLTSGEFGYLYLPPYGVTHGDAERVRQMVDSLVVDVDPRPAWMLSVFLSAALTTGTATHSRATHSHRTVTENP